MEPYQQLEVEFANWVGVSPDCVVACSSGTAALHLALEALGLPGGSEVIVPEYTMIACARAVTLAGLSPIFVDCDDRLLIDPASVISAITPKTKAIMPVHVYGRRCNMVEVHSVAAGNGLKVVEDLAEAHGVSPHTWSDAAIWSFYKNKIIAGEEGGAVYFHDKKCAKLARSLRSLGFTDAHDYNHLPRGHNYRLANCLAEKILVSLREVDTNLEKRKEIEDRYNLYCPSEWRMPSRGVVWVYDVRIAEVGNKQNQIVRALNEAGIKARHGFKIMSSQQEYAEVARVNLEKELPWQALRASNEIIYLPVEPDITTKESIQLSFEIIKEIVG